MSDIANTKGTVPETDGPHACPYLGLPGDPSTRFTFATFAHRCNVKRKPSRIDLAHQGTYCLSSDFRACPRFRAPVATGSAGVGPASAAALAVATASPNALRPVMEGPGSTRSPIRRSTLAALVVLGASMSIAFGVAVARGNLDLPGTGPSRTGDVLGAAATAGPTVVPAPAGSPSSSGGSIRTPAAAPSSAGTLPTPPVGSTPAPSPAGTPPIAPAGKTPAPSVRPRPTRPPTSDRSRLLTRCPGKPRCFIYVVRSGDNLYSIANYFGVPLRTVLRMNPELKGIRRGMRIMLPPPTR